MSTFKRLLLALLLFTCCHMGWAEEINNVPINLLPKYGLLPKPPEMLAADQMFIENVTKDAKGDRKAAAVAFAGIGWEYYRKGDRATAMRRFNQSWLLDPQNGFAVWGMAALESNAGHHDSAQKLFEEAETLVPESERLRCKVDHARMLGIASAQSHNPQQLEQALARFAEIYQIAPDFIENLQNWAITLYLHGNYAKAWEIIKLAEKTPKAKQLSQEFLHALEAKMPRP